MNLKMESEGMKCGMVLDKIYRYTVGVLMIVITGVFLFYIGLERILYKQVHTVGMVGGIVEVGAPATQIFSAYLHVRGYVPEYVGYEILSVAVGTWQVVGITVFRVKAGHAVSA